MVSNIANSFCSQAINKYFAGDDESEFVTILKSLFSRRKSERKTKSKADLSLKSFKDIKAIYNDNSRVFDLERFQGKLMKLIRQWVQTRLPLPSLVKCGYGSMKANDDENEVDLPVNEDVDVEFPDAGDYDVQSQSTSNESQVKPPARKRQKGKNMIDDILEDSSDDGSEKDSKVEELKRKRNSFGLKVKDPLQESVARAASLPARETTTSPKKSRLSAGGSKEVMHKFYQKKNSAQQLEWESSDEEEVEELKMSKVPERLKHKDATESTKESTPVQVQMAGQRSGPTKRKRFTDEEDRAILQGVERFGIGKWAEIKSHFSMELRDRSTVNIKDRYRTLNKSAE